MKQVDYTNKIKLFKSESTSHGRNAATSLNIAHGLRSYVYPVMHSYYISEKYTSMTPKRLLQVTFPRHQASQLTRCTIITAF